MLRHHERTDVNTLTIMWVATAGIVASVVMLLSLAAGFFALKMRLEAKARQTIPEKLIGERTNPPPPLLEINPLPKNQALKVKEQELLTSYGWIDREKGIVRIPITKAIEMLVYEH